MIKFLIALALLMGIMAGFFAVLIVIFSLASLYVFWTEEDPPRRV